MVLSGLLCSGLTLLCSGLLWSQAICGICHFKQWISRRQHVQYTVTSLLSIYLYWDQALGIVYGYPAGTLTDSGSGTVHLSARSGFLWGVTQNMLIYRVRRNQRFLNVGGWTRDLQTKYHTKTVIIIHNCLICNNNPKGIPNTLNVYMY